MTDEAPRFSVRRALLFYTAILGVAFVWGLVRGDLNIFVYERDADGGRPELWLCVLAGVGIGLFFVLGSGVMTRYAWSQKLGGEFRRLLGPLSLTDVTLLAISSAIAEEALFRGAMQPSFGYVLTSLVFGFMHMGPGRTFWPWTLTALVSGFALGWVSEWTGDILAATLAHFTVNYFNLWRIASGKMG